MLSQSVVVLLAAATHICAGRKKQTRRLGFELLLNMGDRLEMLHNTLQIFGSIGK